MHNIEPELKEKIIRLKLEEGRTFQSLEDEFGVPYSTISKWVRRYRDKAQENKEKAQILATMEELGKLRRENEELKKENDFLKKAAAFFAKESR